MKLDEKGITLVELIAALALVSILAAAAWTALFTGMNHGAVETKKTNLQQDANLIISTLMAEHRRSAEYSIIFENNKVKINSCTEAGSCSDREIDKTYNFTGTIVNGHTVDFTSGSSFVIADLTPEKAHTDITLKITDVNNPKRTLSIKTSLTRLLTNQD